MEWMNFLPPGSEWWNTLYSATNQWIWSSGDGQGWHRRQDWFAGNNCSCLRTQTGSTLGSAPAQKIFDKKLFTCCDAKPPSPSHLIMSFKFFFRQFLQSWSIKKWVIHRRIQWRWRDFHLMGHSERFSPHGTQWRTTPWQHPHSQDPPLLWSLNSWWIGVQWLSIYWWKTSLSSSSWLWSAIASSSSSSSPEYDIEPSAQLISRKSHDLVKRILKQRLPGHWQLGTKYSLKLDTFYTLDITSKLVVGLIWNLTFIWEGRAFDWQRYRNCDNFHLQMDKSHKWISVGGWWYQLM